MYRALIFRQRVSFDWQLHSSCTVRAPVFGRHQFFGTSEHYGKAHGSLLSGWINYNYTACSWFPTPSNILILPSQFWRIRFESYWLHCSKCWILVLLRYSVCKHFTQGSGWPSLSLIMMNLRFHAVLVWNSSALCKHVKVVFRGAEDWLTWVRCWFGRGCRSRSLQS